jgi:dinuclear metal center YbgI/SA1388 family protein
MDLKELDRYFHDLLPISDFESVDSSLNGIQVECSSKMISHAAFAVDACMATFERAAEIGADLLFVHHGLFWGRPIAVTRSHYERLKFLLDHDIALYAVHLPLDAHPDFGNNAGIAASLDLEQVEPFGSYRGLKIGCKGLLKEALTVDEVLDRLGVDREECTALLPFGVEKSTSVGIISGGAALDVEQAIREGLDLYITGDALHQVYHTCLEERINLICGGHYQTEVWGVRLVAEKLAQDSGLETSFVDVPTGL